MNIYRSTSFPHSIGGTMKTILQKVTFNCNPHDVYEAIMDAKKHAKFSKSKVTITKRKGSRFTAYDGYIDGKNIELIADKKIVQYWRGKDWPKGHYSKVTFSFKKTKGGTLLTFTQESVPNKHYGHIKKGWVTHYWTPMKKMLERKQ